MDQPRIKLRRCGACVDRRGGPLIPGPVTGGLSGFGAALLYGGAAASTGQCVVSVARVVNVQRGREDVNRSWDANRWYVRTMLAADVVGLVGAGGALKEVKATNAVLREAGYSFSRARQGATISRPMRRALTTALDLQGSSRVSGVVINRVVRQKIDGRRRRCDRYVRQRLFRSAGRGWIRILGFGSLDYEETGQRS